MTFGSGVQKAGNGGFLKAPFFPHNPATVNGPPISDMSRGVTRNYTLRRRLGDKNGYNGSSGYSCTVEGQGPGNLPLPHR